MKTLYILRHAKSSWADPNLDDFSRPLNKRGLRNLPDIATRLVNNCWQPDKIISSSANRALTTAKAVANKMTIENIQQDDGLYMCSADYILSLIQQQQDISSLMIVGHNPLWTDLINLLTHFGLDNLPTGGTAKIEFNINKWSLVNWGTGKVTGLDFPKQPFSAVC
ncbi:phosphohistidine phosphatase [Saccharobesus litoralis]|uniref:Phosphohistidine phosphatase n=1 Tax=Saccharobesus litoralis TaxID=2172099 RepID=A0A2S0VWA5_9ALTE|nr:histidine phosphatase family protein [Saccharobesus litoralis]AWB68390.1 phosphohistidine phosphatase [Saccharobesus litoralis]